MTDEQRTDSLGVYGGVWAETPNLDRLASDSVLFHQAYTPAPICGPARASLLTGDLPHRTGIWNHHAHKRTYRHLIEPFQDAGYQTAAFGKMHHYHKGKIFEFEKEIHYSDEVSPTHYKDSYKEFEKRAVIYPGPTSWILSGSFPDEASKTQEGMMVDDALSWLQEVKKDEPFFLKLSFIGPHTPVTPPSPFDTMLANQPLYYAEEQEKDNYDQPQWFQKLKAKYAGKAVLTAEQIQSSRAAYYGYCSFLDQQFGRILNYLEQESLMDDTIIAFVSDHGTHLGDYGIVQKQSFYDVSSRVPFFIYIPKRTQGGLDIKTPVSIRMMLPLLAEIAGVSCDHELTPYAKEVNRCISQRIEPNNKPVMSEFVINPPQVGHDGRLVMIRYQNLKLSLCLDPEPHDYFMTDLINDPYETINVAQFSEYRTSFNQLKAALFAELTK